MTSRAKHFREAESQLAMAEGLPDDRAAFHLAKAHIHAVLASCPQEVINDVLDEDGLQMLREKEEQWAKDWPPPRNMSDGGE